MELPAFDFIDLSDEQKDEVLKWRNHPDVRSRMFTSHEISKEEHYRFIESLKSDSASRCWMIGDIGVISLKRINTTHRYAYLGIYKNPLHVEKRIAKTLIEVLKRKAFCELKLHTLRLEVFSDNRKAVDFYKRNGFHKEGFLREAVRSEDGVYKDIMVMGLSEKEYFRTGGGS